MGYELDAFLGSTADLRRWKQVLPASTVCRLVGDLHLVPVTGELERQLLAQTGTSDLVHAAPSWAATASRGTVIGHMSGYEFGDRGSDHYAVWANGEIVLRTSSEAAVAAFFRDHAGLDVPVGDFAIGRHRSDNAAEKWARAALPQDQLEGGLPTPAATTDRAASGDSPLPMSDARTSRSQCCVVGGGPAGMMLGYLLARAGVSTSVLEKHGDFLRDFRGDTVHPSTLRVMDELGLLDAFLERPHQKLDVIGAWFGEERVQLGDFRGLPARYAFVALMPQWEFLDFLSGEGKKLPAFTVRMRAEATGLIEEGGRVAGVRGSDEQGDFEIRADCTIGCDGRHSTIRASAGLPVEDVGAPIDVLWFRVGRDPAELDKTLGRIGPGHFVVTLDRGDYWQCAYVVPKGSAEALQREPIAAFRTKVLKAAPTLAAHIGDVRTWDDVKLLTVTIDRLRQWSKPGLLCIGDAAHAMSPVGGVGINLAIQDAVATANLLAQKLRDGTCSEEDLDAVRRRRLWPTRATQAIQVQIQNNVLVPVLSGSNAELRPPLPVRVISALPALQRIFARLLGMGVRPEHVRSPAA